MPQISSLRHWVDNEVTCGQVYRNFYTYPEPSKHLSVAQAKVILTRIKWRFANQTIVAMYENEITYSRSIAYLLM